MREGGHQSQVYRSTAVQEYRHAGVQACRSTGVQEYRCAGVQVCKSTGVQVCRCSGVQDYRCAGVQVCRSTGVHPSLLMFSTFKDSSDVDGFDQILFQEAAVASDVGEAAA